MEIDFKKMANQWFDSKKKLIKPSSVSAYHTIVYAGLVPYFTGKDISDETVQGYVIYKTESGLSKRTIQDHLKTLTYILREGGTDIKFDIEFPTVLDLRKRKSSAFNVSDIKILRSYLAQSAKDNVYDFAILTSLSLGLRIGEVTGLKFSDFDFRSKMVSISRTSQRVSVVDENNKVTGTKVVTGTTKTKSSTRKLPVPGVLLEMVSKHGEGKQPDGFIFKSRFTDFPMDNRLLRTHYYTVLKSLGLPKITFHGLRHSFASNCIASSIDIKTTSAMLGHSDIKMTLDIYTHPNFEQKKAAVNKLGRLFS